MNTYSALISVGFDGYINLLTKIKNVPQDLIDELLMNNFYGDAYPEYEPGIYKATFKVYSDNSNYADSEEYLQLETINELVISVKELVKQNTTKKTV